MAADFEPCPFEPWPVLSREPAGFYEPWPFEPPPPREPWPAERGD